MTRRGRRPLSLSTWKRPDAEATAEEGGLSLSTWKRPDAEATGEEGGLSLSLSTWKRPDAEATAEEGGLSLSQHGRGLTPRRPPRKAASLSLNMEEA
jgi:hypothetical protein